MKAREEGMERSLFSVVTVKLKYNNIISFISLLPTAPSMELLLCPLETIASSSLICIAMCT